MPKASGKEQQAKKRGSIDAQTGYLLTIEHGRVETMQNYDPEAASFLLRTIYNGDFSFTVKVALRSSDVSLEEFAPVTEELVLDNYYSDVPVIGKRVADLLWEALNVSTYGWNRDPNDSSSVKYCRASLPAPDGIDRFVAGYSFLPHPDMVAGDVLDCRREVTELYEKTRSAMGGDNGAGGGGPGLIGVLGQKFSRMSGELATLAEKLGPPPGSLLAEYLFPGSSQKIEVCSQYHSDGNWKSLICATETHMFALDFGTS